jgi:hypothetical protein
VKHLHAITISAVCVLFVHMYICYTLDDLVNERLLKSISITYYDCIELYVGHAHCFCSLFVTEAVYEVHDFLHIICKSVWGCYARPLYNLAIFSVCPHASS